MEGTVCTVFSICFAGLLTFAAVGRLAYLLLEIWIASDCESAPESTLTRPLATSDPTINTSRPSFGWTAAATERKRIAVDAWRMVR